jgi:beta-phosphoglucomutase
MRLKFLVYFVVGMVNCFAGVKAVLFDCDGTLVDSEYAHYLGWKRALNDYGADLSLEEYGPFIGKTAETNASTFAEMTGSQCTGEVILDAKRKYYRELYKAGVPEITQTVQFLKALAAQKESLGIKIGVCSAARREEILFYVRKLQIDHMLDIVLSGYEDLQEYSDPEGVNKPKPYIYLHAMKLLGTLPQETVVIEDSAPGAMAGFTAGCFTIAIPNDQTKQHDFSFAHWRLDSFQDLQVSQFLKMCSNKVPRKKS